MNLCFWNDGSPVFVKPGQQISHKGKVYLIGKKADPSIDLYDYEERGPRPTEFEYPGNVSYSRLGSKVTGTRTVVAKSTDQIRDIVLTKVKRTRDDLANGGLKWSPDGNATEYIPQTDTESQFRMGVALQVLTLTGGLHQIWRMSDNTVALLSADEFKNMALSVAAHVNACFAKQGELEILLKAAATTSDVLSVVIDQGWPSNGLEGT